MFCARGNSERDDSTMMAFNLNRLSKQPRRRRQQLRRQQQRVQCDLAISLLTFISSASSDPSSSPSASGSMSPSNPVFIDSVHPPKKIHTKLCIDT